MESHANLLLLGQMLSHLRGDQAEIVDQFSERERVNGKRGTSQRWARRTKIIEDSSRTFPVRTIVFICIEIFRLNGTPTVFPSRRAPPPATHLFCRACAPRPAHRHFRPGLRRHPPGVTVTRERGLGSCSNRDNASRRRLFRQRQHPVHRHSHRSPRLHLPNRNKSDVEICPSTRVYGRTCVQLPDLRMFVGAEFAPKIRNHRRRR